MIKSFLEKSERAGERQQCLTFVEKKIVRLRKGCFWCNLVQIDHKDSEYTKNSVRSVSMGPKAPFWGQKHFQNLPKDKKQARRPEKQKAGPQFERVTYVIFSK